MTLAFFATFLSFAVALLKVVERFKERENIEVDVQVRMEQTVGTFALRPVFRVFAKSHGTEPMTITSVLVVTRSGQYFEERQPARLERGLPTSWGWPAAILGEVQGVYLSDSAGGRWVPRRGVLESANEEVRRLSPGSAPKPAPAPAPAAGKPTRGRLSFGRGPAKKR